jgi:N-(2-amino-2-carboxyethyl)-L-glutamate synthase
MRLREWAPFDQQLATFELLVGDTPIVDIDVDVAGRRRQIKLKLESHNVGGSIKARTAYGLVRGLVDAGRLRPGSELVESTSGNLGIALTVLARCLGIGFTAVVDPLITASAARRMSELGAKLVMVEERDETGGYLLTRLATLRRLLASDPRYVWPNQYENTDNVEVHRTRTGPEIVRQTGGQLDAVCAAISTGGTFAGLSRYFKESGSATRMVAVDIEGSLAYGTKPGKRYLSGIGASRRSAFLEDWLVDEIEHVSVGESAHFCRTVLAEHGIHLGASSGAVLAGCVRFLAANPDVRNVLCVCADGGDKYADTIYDDRWLESIRLSTQCAA